MTNLKYNTSNHHDSYNENDNNNLHNRTIIVFTSSYNIQCGVVLRALQTRHINYIEINISTSLSAHVRESGGFESFMKDYYKVTNVSYSVPKICIYYHNSVNNKNNADKNDNCKSMNSNNRSTTIHLIHGVDDILQEIRHIEFFIEL